MLDEDVKLMLRFKQGDNSSFEALLDKYHNPIINFIYRFIGDKAESEDLAQEVFLRVYRSVKTYVPKAKFSTWIYIIANNLALNELRRRELHKTSSLDEVISYEEGDLPRQVSDQRPIALRELEKQDLIDAVRRAINSLPDNQKVAVILKKYQDFSYEEIAKVIGCSVSAVKSLLNRSKEALKEKLINYVEK
jgi:RNA polymerase sigma-70 factor (ECF subfamily)